MIQGISLTPSHLAKRQEKKEFSLRYDIFGSFLQQALEPKDYFDFCFSYPREAERILIDGMYDGDWYSVYESALLPQRHCPFLDRLHQAGVDIYGEFLKQIHGEGKECFLVHRIAEVGIDPQHHPVPERTAHPEWFLPAFGFQLCNMAAPEIRAHKLQVLEEVMRKYDFDGLDIDYQRHTPILPVGKQWEMRECVTDFMRKLRQMLCRLEEETGRVIQLSARVPDCLAGCREDGLDIAAWIREDLVDALTLGSRSYDVHAEEFRALSTQIQLFGCYELHHTLDGYALPPIETVHGVCYAWRKRGADGVECFNWTGQGKAALLSKYLAQYGKDPIDYLEVLQSTDDFHQMGNTEYLEGLDKTYVVDRRGGYPWSIGFANRNDDKQLPLAIQQEGVVRIFLPEDIAGYRKVTLQILLAETEALPTVDFAGRRLTYQARPHRDPQVTALAEAPISGHGVYLPLAQGEDRSRPCTLLTADITGLSPGTGYREVRLSAPAPIQVEKVEVVCKK